jgi:hypothetical protein
VVNAVAGYFLNRNVTGARIHRRQDSHMWVQVKFLFWASGASNLHLNADLGNGASAVADASVPEVSGEELN